MGNWIDELDEDTKRYDRELREGAEKYDKELREGAERYDTEVMCCCGDKDEDDEVEAED